MKPQHGLAALPFGGILVGIFFANRTETFVLGLTFALFWVTLTWPRPASAPRG
jgi:hypothetical protein